MYIRLFFFVALLLGSYSDSYAVARYSDVCVIRGFSRLSLDPYICTKQAPVNYYVPIDTCLYIDAGGKLVNVVCPITCDDLTTLPVGGIAWVFNPSCGLNHNNPISNIRDFLQKWFPFILGVVGFLAFIVGMKVGGV